MYHLKARLATMGCMLNTIWAYDNNRWFPYNQYNVPHSLNQAFITQFKDSIPAGTLYGDCIDICTFNELRGEVVEGRKCATFEEERQRGGIADYGTILNLPVDKDTPCDDDFDSRVKQHIFQLLPILSNTCIVRQVTENPISVRGRIGLGHDNTLFFVLIWFNMSQFKSEEAIKALRENVLHTEIHELCHIQQEYYTVQQFIPYRYNSFLGSDWYSTEAYKKFQNLTGFKEIQTESYLDFSLPENSIFKEIYSTNPKELSAELCTLYLLEKIGEESLYTSLIYTDLDDPEYEGYKILKTPFDSSLYLTPEIVEWLETYMVLPYPNYENEQE